MKRCIRIISAGVMTAALGGGPALAADRQQNPQAQQQQQNPKQQQTQQAQPQQEQEKRIPPAAVVNLSDLEENAQQHIGRRITLSGEVGDVLGPRVFKIDERNWADLDGEILVVTEAPLAALVKEEDPVTVTGTLRRFADFRIDREWGWLGLEPEVEARVKTRPVLVATAIVGSDPDLGMIVAVGPPQSGRAPSETAGTSGTSGKGTTAGERGTPFTDSAELAKSRTNEHVGRRVNLSSVRVDRAVKDGGFWVSSGGEELFILPADGSRAQPGQTVNIEGYVFRLPEQMESRLEKSNKTGNEEIYVYASSVK